MRIALLATLAMLVLAGCDPGVELGERCERSGQCPAPLSCVLGRCRTECIENADCPIESECVPVAEGGVCRLPTDTCASDTECTAPLVCGADAVCRATCLDDAECPSGSSCELSAGRLLCVRRVSTLDAGSDAAVDGGTPMSCPASGNARLQNGMDGFCVEASAGIVAADRIRRDPFGDGAAEIDLQGALPGGWIRAWQEVPLTEDLGLSFFFPEIAVASGAVVVALEGYDARGELLVRVALFQANGVDAPCDATGRTSDWCGVGVGPDMGLGWWASAESTVDLRSIASVRRVVEVIAGPSADARVVLDGITERTPSCALAWWRREPGEILDETFDRPATRLAPGLTWAATGPLRLFPAAACSNMLGFDGTSFVEGRPIALGPGPITLTLWWHPPIAEPLPISGERVLFEQLDGDLMLAVRDRRIVARAGRCMDGRAALEVLDTTFVGPEDNVAQELGVMLDREAGRLCLLRRGHLIGCQAAPRCPLGAAGTGGVRIGSGSAPGTGWVGGIDELRIRMGDHAPRAMGASGRCHLDRVCMPYGTVELRDEGSGACVPASSCTSVATCPERAADPGFLCGTGSLACGVGATCLEGVRDCASTEPDPCVPAEFCASEVAPLCP